MRTWESRDHRSHTRRAEAYAQSINSHLPPTVADAYRTAARSMERLAHTLDQEWHRDRAVYEDDLEDELLTAA